MKSEEEIRQKIAEIKRDGRYKAAPALVQINAPLALIQVNLKGRLEALQWVLDDKG
jgi:hypothetical protein